MSAYPNEKLYAIAQENYRILQGYCEVLEQEGYWEEPQSFLNRPIRDFLALYIQAVLVQAACYIGAEDTETLRMIINMTGDNPLAVDEGEGIMKQTAEEAGKLALSPPILLQLCGLRDVEHGSSMAGLFLDAVFNIVFAAAYLNQRSSTLAADYVREYFGRVQAFVQNAGHGGYVDELYLSCKICNIDLEGNTALLKEAGLDFALYKKEAFLLEEPSAKNGKKALPSAGGAADVQEDDAEDPTDSGDGYGYSEDEEFEEEEYLQEEYEFEDELVCADEEEETPEEVLNEPEDELAVTVLSAAEILRGGRSAQSNAERGGSRYVTSGTAALSGNGAQRGAGREEDSIKTAQNQDGFKEGAREEADSIKTAQGQDGFKEGAREEADSQKGAQNGEKPEEEPGLSEDGKNSATGGSAVWQQDVPAVTSPPPAVLPVLSEADKEAATRAALASFKAKRMEKLMNRLDDLVGLAGVKEEIRSLINLIRVRKMREEYHLPGMPMSYHMVFTGSPGTGKTTVARLVGEIYRELGILSKGMMIETDRAGLVAGYVGQTAIKVKEVVEKARGGVLFIDEAYTLSNAAGGNDFGTEAIDMLVKLMEDYREDLVIIVAGYTQEMETFLKSNTGLISRFNKFIDFPDYADEELVDILFGMAKKAGFSLDGEVSEAVRAYLVQMKPQERADFGNARGIRNLFEKMVAAQANRVVGYGQPTKEQLSSIVLDDCKFFA